MKNLNEDLTKSEDKVIKESITEPDYKMECNRLWKENDTQRIIIKALVFYIQEAQDV
mgnify:CR=1 FL=1